MKKRNGLLFIVTAVLLTGCFHDDDAKQNENVGHDQRGIQNLTLIAQGQLNCSSEDGYYYVAGDGFQMTDGTFAYNMMYMDYETQQEIFLCNRPGCKHNTLDCPSVFADDEIQLGSSLFFMNDKLYLFSHGADQDGVSIQNFGDQGIFDESSQVLDTKPTFLMQMDPDGMNRKKIWEWNHDEFVEDAVLSDGKSLFVFTKKLTGESTKNTSTYIHATDRRLVEIDMDDGTTTEIAAIPVGDKVIGCSDDKIVFTSIDYGKSIDGLQNLSDDEYLAIYNNSTTNIVVLDVNQGKTKTVLSLPNSKLNSFAVGDDVLYYGSEGTKQIRSVHLENGEDSVFKETAANEINGIYDEVLLCSKWDDASASVSDSPMHFIHLQDRKEDVSNLKQSVMGNDIIIRKELSDQFLVVYDYDAQIDPKYDNNQYTIYGLKYALIAKHDLYTGKANYKKIKMIGFGE